MFCEAINSKGKPCSYRIKKNSNKTHCYFHQLQNKLKVDKIKIDQIESVVEREKQEKQEKEEKEEKFSIDIAEIKNDIINILFKLSNLD